VWNRLRQEGSSVAIVFDEQGATAGMITIEDMIEEIFGDVEDEFDSEPIALTRGLDGRAQLAGDELVEEELEDLGACAHGARAPIIEGCRMQHALSDRLP
jgi:putative hemolysin